MEEMVSWDQDAHQVILLADRVHNLPRFGGMGRHWRMFLVFAFMGFLYGGLHCLAWNLQFPSKVERVLWRIAAVGVAATGPIMALAYLWELHGPSVRHPVHFASRRFEAASRWIQSAPTDATGRKLAKQLRSHSLFGPMGFLLSLLWGGLILLFDILLPLVLVAYTLARVYLVAESVRGLWYLPDSVLSVPEWSKFVPHIG
ncbi:hypothetical protein QBC34DRAFT_410195 [Podospora aff. communis PSN243]|uniref:Uncharacterized protein n=1 Tax=Podospora aff. communis PSN243 TaxID=3040156 RepID=A0AAV9GJV5_9PEZI|nr:hypothetical protein QBC34DRAFT_410195 [Podospora aff. communis PSN243]